MEPRSGTYVVDWQHRMNAYAFDGPARPKCAPKKGRNKLFNTMTRTELRNELCQPWVLHPLAINCAAPAPKSPSPFD